MHKIARGAGASQEGQHSVANLLEKIVQDVLALKPELSSGKLLCSSPVLSCTFENKYLLRKRCKQTSHMILSIWSKKGNSPFYSPLLFAVQQHERLRL